MIEQCSKLLLVDDFRGSCYSISWGFTNHTSNYSSRNLPIMAGWESRERGGSALEGKKGSQGVRSYEFSFPTT